VFGVVSDADETPIGRASVALKAELPSLFPEQGFEILGPQDLTEIGQAEADRLLFRVLASQVRNTDHGSATLPRPNLFWRFSRTASELCREAQLLVTIDRLCQFGADRRQRDYASLQSRR
jgi:hypothetical protein